MILAIFFSSGFGTSSEKYDYLQGLVLVDNDHEFNQHFCSRKKKIY